MKLFFSLLFILSFAVSPAQERIDEQIKKLDNSQFIINHDEKASFSMKSPAAMKLIKMRTKPTAKLIEALKDENKNVMAHLVLCHIWFNHATFAGPKYSSSENDRRIARYFLGNESGEGAVISEEKRNGTYHLYIEKEELDKLIAFWKTKTGK